MPPEVQGSNPDHIGGQISARFDKLDTKIDKMADALYTLARVDEKVFAQHEAISRLFLRMEKTEIRVSEILLCMTKANGDINSNTKSVQTIYRGGVFITCAFTLSAVGIFMAWLFDLPPLG